MFHFLSFSYKDDENWQMFSLRETSREQLKKITGAKERKTLKFAFFTNPLSTGKVKGANCMTNFNSCKMGHKSFKPRTMQRK